MPKVSQKYLFWDFVAIAQFVALIATPSITRIPLIPLGHSVKDKVEHFCLKFCLKNEKHLINISIIKKPFSVQPCNSWFVFYNSQAWYVA